MSFSSLVKEELLQIPLGSREENYSEFYGIIMFNNNSFRPPYILVSENENMVQKALDLSPNELNLAIQKNNALYYLSSTTTSSKESIIKYLNPLIYKINTNKLLSRLLRGAFLACGTVTNPESNYHLEFSLSDEKLSEYIISLINRVKIVNLKPNLMKRRSKYIVYVKDNSQITDLLTFIGATNSSMQFIQVKMLKEVRNYINRTTNFETANITKTTDAASKQVKAIKHIIKSKGLDSLPNDLYETAVLRLNNPYMSLDELSTLYKEPITRSGVNYRLGKILKIAHSL